MSQPPLPGKNQREATVTQTSLPPESPNEQVDSFSVNDSDSEKEVDSILETTLSIICLTRLGRIRTFTGQMTDFLQAGISGMSSGRNL